MGRSPQYTRSSGNGQYQQQLGQQNGRPASFPASTADTQPNMAAAVQSSHFVNTFGRFPNLSAPIPAHSTSNVQGHPLGSGSNASYVPVASTSGYQYESSSTFPSPNHLPNFPLSMSSLQDLRPQALALSLAGPQATLTMTNQQNGSYHPTFLPRDLASSPAKSVVSTSNSQTNIPMAADAANALCVSPELIMTAPSSVGYSRSSSRAQSPISSPTAMDYTAATERARDGASHTENTSAYASSSATSSPLIRTAASHMLSTNANLFNSYETLPLSTTTRSSSAAVSSFPSRENSQTGSGASDIYNTSWQAQYNTGSSSAWQGRSRAGIDGPTFQPGNTAYIATPGAVSHQIGHPNSRQSGYPRTFPSYTMPSSLTENTYSFQNLLNGHSSQSAHPTAPLLNRGAPPYSGYSDFQLSRGAGTAPSDFYTGPNANPTAGLVSVHQPSTGFLRTSSVNDSLNGVANMHPRRTVSTPGPSIAYAPYPTAGRTGLPPLPEYGSQRMQYTRSSTMSAHSPFVTPRRAVSAYELHDLSQYGPDTRPYGTKTRLNKQGLIHSSDVENAYPGEWGDAFR